MFGDAFLERRCDNKGDTCSTLMSLLDPGTPKKACQNHKSDVVIASRTTVGYFSLPFLYCPLFNYYTIINKYYQN